MVTVNPQPVHSLRIGDFCSLFLPSRSLIPEVKEQQLIKQELIADDHRETVNTLQLPRTVDMADYASVNNFCWIKLVPTFPRSL